MKNDMLFKRKVFSNFSDLRELESEFVDFLKVNRVPSDIVYDLKIAVHEFMLNIMEHGYHWDSQGEINFETQIERKDDFLEIEIKIRDYAKKFEISKEKILKSVNNKSFRGRGLMMIMTFVDEFYSDPSVEEGNLYILKKRYNLND
jgi:anti-sigma regulatory factor (Ser/Thr protein kinase)